MLQLIIGISLGIILLFVIVLLVTEMMATYPVWKQFHRPADLHESSSGSGKSASSTFLLLLLACLVVLAIVALLITNKMPGKQVEENSLVHSASKQESIKTEKFVVDSMSQPGIFFRSESKWEDGKMYCNNRVFFENPQPPTFTEMRFSFQDKDHFQISELQLTPGDFVTETNGYGGVSALLNRSTVEMSVKEYGRIEILQVVLDKKVQKH